MIDEAAISQKYRRLAHVFGERTRRLWAGAEAQALGRGGIAALARVTGLTRNTVARGVREPEEHEPLEPLRVRHPGGGRKRETVLYPRLLETLEQLVEPVSRGDPESPLRWTCKSTKRLAEKLKHQGYDVSDRLVAALLYELEYSLQSNRKTKEGTRHPDRNAQFEHINRKVAGSMRRGQPARWTRRRKNSLAISRTAAVNGVPWAIRKRSACTISSTRSSGRLFPTAYTTSPEGAGWVSVGVDHDTATFAVNTIRRWWREMGRTAYGKARSLLILADSGGSNGSRLRLWKWELQRLANDTGFTINVCHLPPGTSKWNKIEHRLFSFITKNWRGRPLLTHATIVNLIAGTRTSTGLKVRCVLDKKRYPTKVKVSDDEMARINLRPDKFHGDWNYSIRPRTSKRTA